MNVLPHLPIEIYGLIIDDCASCAGAQYPHLISDSYDTLRACSLTCVDWLPRSRFNLYSVVTFTRSNQVDKLCATLASNPCLGKYVRALRIDHCEGDMPRVMEYIPFARYELVSRIPNVRILALRGVDWRVYPPRYHVLASCYPITELFMWTPLIRSPFDTLRVILTFHRLEHLHVYLHPDLRNKVKEHEGLSALWHSNVETQKSRFASLKSLEVDRPNEIWSESRYPLPLHVVGASIVVLSVRRDLCMREIESAVDVAGITSHCPRLEEIIIVEDFYLARYVGGLYYEPVIMPLIDGTKSHKRMRQISFRFWPPQVVWTPIVGAISRRAFLETILGARSTPSPPSELVGPRTLVFTLPCSSSRNGWDTPMWEETISALSPRWKSVRVVVELSTKGVETQWPYPWIDANAETPEHKARRSYAFDNIHFMRCGEYVKRHDGVPRRHRSLKG